MADINAHVRKYKGSYKLTLIRGSEKETHTARGKKAIRALLARLVRTYRGECDIRLNDHVNKVGRLFPKSGDPSDFTPQKTKKSKSESKSESKSNATHAAHAAPAAEAATPHHHVQFPHVDRLAKLRASASAGKATGRATTSRGGKATGEVRYDKPKPAEAAKSAKAAKSKDGKSKSGKARKPRGSNAYTRFMKERVAALKAAGADGKSATKQARAEYRAQKGD